MSDTSPNLALPYLAPAQAQKHVTVNEALTLLDILARLSVLGFAAETPPPMPEEGEVWALGPAPSGDWAGQAEGTLAAFADGAWLFLPPRPGWAAALRTGPEIRVWDGTAWRAADIGSGTPDTLGVGTSADAANPLSVRGPGVLFTHADGDHRITVNKGAAGDTASLLFQSGYSGRAEMGLAGTDNWSLKVSPDGTAWTEALVVDAVTGRATGAAVQSAPEDAAPGKLMRADWGYGRATLVGTVSEAGGQPTGAAIETGSTSSGSYTRFADGTQVCRISGLATVSGDAALWTYPAPFVAPPAVIVTCRSGTVPRIATTAARSATSTEIRSFDLGGSEAVTPECDVIAEGRWF
ncbi:hypothetical protein ROJ8625_02848 [Roseivivax jejudonensis]|uniref:DUF2793 domain-containing protein n=1 Tax=Roseivivax jejudonensis TaxID=1529041 RepID=A0A1X6ZNU3_9RHOB|nr:DUF2793 domain-containing protein [Roseivivax jejudonensis]SLN57078.1 hypothetical protein ROJ8625_02848 [Roseivivax jejudonensis]